jgi:hypothetical protein
MESPHHLIVHRFTDRAYVEGDAAQEYGINNRCWCVFEMAIQDCLAVKLPGNHKSEIVLLDAMRQVVKGPVPTSTPLAASISREFRVAYFLDRLQGRPVRVLQIKAWLVSDRFFGSEGAFNEHSRKHLVKLYGTTSLTEYSENLITEQEID